MPTPSVPPNDPNQESDDPLRQIPDQETSRPSVWAGSGGDTVDISWDGSEPPSFPELRASDLQSPRQRRVLLPVVLFLVTCASTFWVGATDWMPLTPLGSWPLATRALMTNWPQGVTYMCAVMAILIMHEMGHFFFTLRYHIPASYPLFIPVPINPIGTMGAVIGMDGLKANRRELFDLGLAGPLAGLVVAVPIMWIGISRLDLTSTARGDIAFHSPLLVQLLMAHLRPELSPDVTVGIRQLNPYFIAGWVGLLITGLNMLPISQLDGGHVTYALFGRRAHTIARAFLVVSIFFIVVHINEAYIWTMMLILVILMGTDHPPTSDDGVSLGAVRWTLGVMSLVIPIFCFPLWGIDT